MTTSQLAERIEQGAVAQQSANGASILGLLNNEKMKRQLQDALPRHLDGDRFLRVVVTEVRRNPALLAVTPQSFLGALMEAAALGLEPGPLGHAYLLPFRNRDLGVVECQLILGYKGLIDLARRSGNIVNIVAREVCANDEFDFQYGLEEKLVHKPLMSGDRGKAVAYYGVAHYKGGGHLILVLSKADVERYRSRSRAKSSGPWVTDYTAMALKTVVRRMATFMPLSVQALEAVAVDEQRELGVDAGMVLDVQPPEQPVEAVNGEVPFDGTSEEPESPEELGEELPIA